MTSKLLSIVVPCYNEEEAIPIFHKEVCRVVNQMHQTHNTKFEFIFVNDGSKDNTLKEVKQLRASDERIRYVSFSRNFGKEAAMLAGLKAAKGDYVATMDVDLQDPPQLLPSMLETLLQKEYDCVATRRVTRKGEPPIRSFFARMFYKLINKMSDVEIVDGARDYRLMTRQMVQAVLSMEEYNRFSKGIFSWVGFKTKWLEYENVERVAGETKWNFWKLFKYAIEGIVGYTTVPLLFTVPVGVMFCLIAVVSAIILEILGKTQMGGSGIVCLLLFCSGVQLLAFGVMGEYLAKTYTEVKNRPVYIVKETESILMD